MDLCRVTVELDSYCLALLLPKLRVIAGSQWSLLPFLQGFTGFFHCFESQLCEVTLEDQQQHDWLL